MKISKRLVTGTAAGVLLSTLVHAALTGTLYYGFVLHEPAPIVAELDLSMTPLVSLPPNAGGGSGSTPSDTWVTPKQGKAPAPQLAPVLETKEEVQKQETQDAPCVEPCPQNENVIGTGWGGGNGEGEGHYIPASQASKKPRWIKNFITFQDYPLVARQEGKNGRVVLLVLIDDEGRVRDARLLEGSYDALNEVALRKVREAIFSPAYDENNRPVSCKVTIPIRFELR